MFSIEVRAIEKSFDARLSSPKDGWASGKIKWKSLRDGATLMKIKARKLGGPKHFTVRLYIDGQPVAETAASDGRLRWRLDSREGDDVPGVANGQRAELRSDDDLLLSGIFEPD